MIRAGASPRFRTIGQPVAHAILWRAAATGRIGRTLLVHGPPGAGKGAFLEDLLALLFCTAEPASRPCDACRGCRQARGRSHPDLVIGSPGLWRAQRTGGESIVASARRWLLGAAGSPLVAERRVVVVEEADEASEQIQNALLKALEEPGDRQVFVLVAADPLRLLPTIRSRCQALRVGPVPRQQLAAWLVDDQGLPADLADELARLSGGMAGAAVRMSRQPDAVEWRRRVQAELLSLLAGGRADRFASARELLADAARWGGPRTDDGEADLDPAAAPAGARQRAGALLLVDAWLGLARDLLVAAAGREELSASGSLHAELVGAARRIGPRRAAAFVRRLEQVRVALGENAAPALALDVAMLDWPTLPPGPR